MSSFDDITLADLRDLAKNLSVAAYGTKADIIGRLTQHQVGVSMLKTLSTNKTSAKKELTTTTKTTKPNGKTFTVKEKLSPKFCKDFEIQYLSKSTKDGVTTYTYVENKKKAVAKKTIAKKSPAKKIKKEKDEDEEDEDEEMGEDEDEDEDENADFDFNFFKTKLKKTLSKDRAFANKLLHMYEPTVPMKQIQELSPTKLFNAIADIMCFDEE